MTSKTRSRSVFLLLLVLALGLACPAARAQAALLLEEPYGFFGAVNPTGHNAVYLARVCAETPVQLRRCQPGEGGVVIARYQGIAGYDWVAIPLIPYLYAVEDAGQAPDRVDRASAARLRSSYRERNLMSLGESLPAGGFTRGGWAQLTGASFDRRIFALRFETTEAQDDALIARLNASPNRSRFNLLVNNCSDFARSVLNLYFPDAFPRSVFPDAGMTTPKQLTSKLARYARKHPELKLETFEIGQVPGLHRASRRNKSISESLVTTAWVAPLIVVSPYVAGGLAVDYLVRGRFHPIARNRRILDAETVAALTARDQAPQNPVYAGAEPPEPTGARPSATQVDVGQNLQESKDAHE